MGNAKRKLESEYAKLRWHLIRKEVFLLQKTLEIMNIRKNLLLMYIWSTMSIT